ncbi:hypothetical protein [Polaribacter sp. Asnod6-C07]|uniref:hypothetical protein n=1 Tax=Polaribacter sp. Asnod6-C07 TaxID=3160582 RepID=UPI00386E52E5
MNKPIFLVLIILIFASCNEKKKILKSEIAKQNDTIVGVKNYDRKGRLTFNKTTQIIENWNNDLMSWMTAKIYSNNRIIFRYYAHSNLTLNKTIYDYDKENNLRENYTLSVPRPENKERNHYREIYGINSSDSLKKYIDSRLVILDTLRKTVNSKRKKEKFYLNYKDKDGNLTKEFWTIIDSIEISKTIEKYNNQNLLISEYKRTRYNEGINNFKYNENGQLIEELEKYDIESDGFQRKVHNYDNDKLIKTFFYHDNDLAFTYEYLYKDTLLIRQINKRITNSKAFSNRKKEEIIDYEYSYYE